MLICQEMFLLLTKDNGKKEVLSNNETALRAGLLAICSCTKQLP
ncbi:MULTISPECIES: hypothetical protein [unclassified Corynebacterium]|nr:MULTISPECIES: hypothetical protein [unclassified Corynebacterium]MDK8475592.1 hypothetical protein [Corynebacterium sp. MSK310]MDK8491290.1 hypothetical protein [Corynebacterium sp. MSK175]MDK8672101.1 hypothetical protein [Corynebacterium sp. MSK189]MDK8697598.1 hypothetical protein [Corynebacterium sp. MSK192]MDK8735469.1 hypothetical protein [Corynebacterium sp. MSK306]